MRIIDHDLLSIQEARILAENAYEAQKALAAFPQEKLDEIVERMAEAVSKHTKELAVMSSDETDYGKWQDKYIKNRFACEYVPAKLRDKEIHMLDLAALVAGTQFRGQFESRIKGLVEEVRSDGNIILFIDEVHSLVGTGDAEGSMNAANILKPSLSRGEIQIIGATTFTEYRKYIEKDAALERRLQPIRVEEPSIEQTVEMLKGVKDYYEDFHRVSVTDTLIEKAVRLSERYINDRFLPDKAIDLLDEACTCANLRNKNISNFEIASANLAELESREAELMDASGEADYEEIAKVKA